MLKEIQAVQDMVKQLESEYDIDIIRIYHEQNQIQLIGTKSFGKLPVENVSVIRKYTEKHDCWTGRFEGTEFIYLVERNENDVNN